MIFKYANLTLLYHLQKGESYFINTTKGNSVLLETCWFIQEAF